MQNVSTLPRSAFGEGPLIRLRRARICRLCLDRFLRPGVIVPRSTPQIDEPEQSAEDLACGMDLIENHKTVLELAQEKRRFAQRVPTLSGFGFKIGSPVV